MPVKIVPVTDKRELKRFVLYPWQLYRDNPTWVAPIMIGEKDMFNPKKDPFHAHAESQHFLAYREGRLVGRVSAIIDRNYIEFHEEKTGFMGFFEAEDDEETARALFNAAESWIRERKMHKIMCPMNPSTNHIMGVLIDSFDIPPTVQMGYNPPYYQRLYEASGFGKEQDLYCYLMDTSLGLSDKITRVADLVTKRGGITVRTIDMKDYKAEVERIRDLYNSAWEKNWGFVPWTREEFDWMAADLKLIANPKTVLMAEKDGELVGVCIPLPDINQVLMKMNGRLFPFGLFRLLAGKKKIHALRLAILGVRPDFHNKGIDALLVYEVYTRGEALGYRSAELSWVLESNMVLRNMLEKWGAKHYRTYRVYGKELG